jgi:hypothetical protein
MRVGDDAGVMGQPNALCQCLQHLQLLRNRDGFDSQGWHDHGLLGCRVLTDSIGTEYYYLQSYPNLEREAQKILL